MSKMMGWKIMLLKISATVMENIFFSLNTLFSAINFLFSESRMKVSLQNNNIDLQNRFHFGNEATYAWENLVGSMLKRAFT